MFELVTGEFLFKPKRSELMTEEECIYFLLGVYVCDEFLYKSCHFVKLKLFKKNTFSKVFIFNLKKKRIVSVVLSINLLIY